MVKVKFLGLETGKKPSDEELLQEMAYTIAYMTEPDNRKLANQFGGLLLQDLLVSDFPDASTFDTSPVVEILFARAVKVCSKFVSAGMVANTIVNLVRMEADSSLNKAATLVAEQSLEMGEFEVNIFGQDRRIALITGTKNVATNFRTMRGVAHLWGAWISPVDGMKDAGFLDQFHNIMDNAQLSAVAIRASKAYRNSQTEWTLMPRLNFAYKRALFNVTQPNGSGNDVFRDYRNPNWV